MPRSDLSNYLVHWTKGEDYNEAYDVLRNIVFEKKIIGTGNNIREGWECVCFTEAPESAFHEVAGQYKPFGIQVPKSWLFSLGGRPVIYQASNEYDLLPDSIKWRHMRYEPDHEPPFDYSWEREWRIQTNELAIVPEYSRILVPDQEWVDLLINEHNNYQEMELHYIASVYGEEWLAAPIDELAFKCSIIEV